MLPCRRLTVCQQNRLNEPANGIEFSYARGGKNENMRELVSKVTELGANFKSTKCRNYGVKTSIDLSVEKLRRETNAHKEMSFDSFE